MDAVRSMQIVAAGEEAARTHLSRLLRDLDLRADLAQPGREHVLAHYAQAQVAAETHELYQALLEK